MRYTNTIAHGKGMGKAAALAAIPMVLAYASCSRDHLYYETSLQPNVQLNIDWSQTAFSPSHPSYDPDNPLNGVTIFAYDAATQRLVAEFPLMPTGAPRGCDSPRARTTWSSSTTAGTNCLPSASARSFPSRISSPASPPTPPA